MRHTGRSRDAREADGSSSEGLSSATTRPRDTPAKSAPLFPPSVPGLLDHVGCHASRSMRPTICRKRVDVKWLSATCRMKYRACRMRRPPVLNSRCCRLVSDQLWMASGRMKPAQEITQVVGDNPQEQAHLVSPEAVTGEARSGWRLCPP